MTSAAWLGTIGDSGEGPIPTLATRTPAMMHEIGIQRHDLSSLFNGWYLFRQSELGFIDVYAMATSQPSPLSMSEQLNPKECIWTALAWEGCCTRDWGSSRRMRWLQLSCGVMNAGFTIFQLWLGDNLHCFRFIEGKKKVGMIETDGEFHRSRIVRAS